MQVMAFEGIVENGQIRLKADIHLPENTPVYVIIPDLKIEQVAHVSSPSLAHLERVVDFEKTVVEELPQSSPSDDNGSLVE